jgi:hypothetical protein
MPAEIARPPLWWRIGASVFNVLRCIGYGLGTVWLVLVMAWGIGILLWFALLIALGSWVIRHWWIGLPAILAVLLIGRLILRWAAKTRCDICKRPLEADPTYWTIANLHNKKPDARLRFVHIACQADVALP